MKTKKVLVIKRNLLRWYNELTDELEHSSPTFPPSVLTQIQKFGDYELEFIDEKETHLKLKGR